ncbi:addiction module toxin RelE [Neisseria chenwenguii]|uniref:Addiction module toxin RelE n=1 Tax=Neisseria chenwenguii TaxID=1853278 RepID=A0A220S1T3_9NEIS|nr:ribbon-helix-helix domain-containing protein [Neisseria chenwenguii]ASK27434.1 addiction module toxin RelE [Neisseria chenwenguii]
MKPQTVPVAVKLPLEIRDRLKAVAETQDRSVHWLMREAVNQFLEREEQKAALRAAADASWAHYQETGLHVTLEEANVWMDTIIEGREAGELKCHK